MKTLKPVAVATVALAGVLSSTTSNAAPSVSSVSMEGTTLTITGSSFGAKTPAAPWLFDGFEGHPPGTGMDGKHPQIGTATYERYSSQGTEGAYSSDLAYSGSQSAKTINSTSGSTTTDHFAFRGQAAKKRFISYRVYATGRSGVHKGDRQTANLGNGNDNPLYDSPPNFGRDGYLFTNNCSEFVNHGYLGGEIDDTWQRIDQWIVVSTPDVADGRYDYYIDNVLRGTAGDYATCTSACSHGCQVDSWISPNYVNKTEDLVFWIDDLYVDGTQARVELCSGALWTSRGNCNIQIPTGWSATSITALGNTASFAHGQTAFVYVVDADGTVNSSGKEVTIGGSAQDTTPPALSAGSPSGTLASGTTQTTMSVSTDEAATCRWSATPGTAYANMTDTFSSTGGTTHSTTLTGLSDGQSYTRYVRCSDGAGNANGSDYPISFNVAAGSTCTPGGACTSADGCQSGTLSCSTGSPVCSSLTNRPDGTACTGGVCSLGACTACAVGQACASVDGCRTGSIDCSSGEAVCASLSARPDGTACAGGVCSSGACSACSTGQACTSVDGCRAGTFDCASGQAVCADQTDRDDGAPCPGGACHSGTCHACVSSAVCTPTTECKRGAIDCSTGLPVCEVTEDLPDGSSCSSGACSGGVCLPGPAADAGAGAPDAAALPSADIGTSPVAADASTDELSPVVPGCGCASGFPAEHAPPVVGPALLALSILLRRKPSGGRRHSPQFRRDQPHDEGGCP